MKHIAIFASGAGSNASNIIRHLRDSDKIRVALIITNNPQAGVINIAREAGIPCELLKGSEIRNEEVLMPILKNHQIDFIVLAGFLLLIPAYLARKFDHRIINIHPALLPSYGGKGMYGHFVHESVHANKERESGITIHYVNEHYDEGEIIFQKKVAISESDTPADIEAKVRALEINYFPQVLEEVVLKS